MMRYISTRNSNCEVSFSEALLRGTAEDGGLPVPKTLPDNVLNWSEVVGWDYQRLASEIISYFIPDFSYFEIEECVGKAYGSGSFSDNEPVKVHSLDGQLHILELFHGPTAAFKDLGLQLLPQFIDLAAEKLGLDKEICIMTATSGDTGSAAIYGFGKSNKAKTITVYPAEGISAVQKAQMENAPFENAERIKVDGCFDDAQKAVKECLGDADFRAQADASGIQITAANSMNIGRLVPQIVYYVYAYAEMIRNGSLKAGDVCDVAVPSGNFGNILAAWYAGKLGVPFRTYICASNRNNVLADFFRTGCYDRRREFISTISPSMDILVSSNLERLLYHLTEDCELVRLLQRQLVDDGYFNFDISNAGFVGGSADDQQTLEMISSFYRGRGYLLDPHTAVALSVVANMERDDVPLLVAATASPLKFAETVLEAIGETVPEKPQDAVEKVAVKAGVEVPGEITRVLKEEGGEVVKVTPEELTMVLKEKILKRGEN